MSVYVGTFGLLFISRRVNYCNLNPYNPSAIQNAELRARVSIVGQRKARLLQSVNNDLAESKRLRSTIEGMHMDMARLNEFIGKSGRRVS